MAVPTKQKSLELDWNRLSQLTTQFGITLSLSSSLLHEVISEFLLPSFSDDFERALWRGESLIRDTLIDTLCRDVRLSGARRNEILNQLIDDELLGQIVMKIDLLFIFPNVTFSPAELDVEDLARLLKVFCGSLALDVGREKTVQFIELLFWEELERIKSEW